MSLIAQIGTKVALRADLKVAGSHKSLVHLAKSQHQRRASETGRERQTEREKQTDRQTDRRTDRQLREIDVMQTETQAQTHRQAGRQIG